MFFEVNIYDTVHLNIHTQRHIDPLRVCVDVCTHVLLLY